MYMKIMDTKNYDINKGLIIEPIEPEDFILGAERSLDTKFGAEILQPDGNLIEFLPASEKQAPGYETSACVMFATLTAIESLENKKFFDKANLSDRFVAKLSGTDPHAGNDQKKVAQFIRDNWSVLEEEWATADALSTDEFYADPRFGLTSVALARGAQYEFGYEWVTASKTPIKTALTKGTTCMSVPAWYKDENGEYYRPDG